MTRSINPASGSNGRPLQGKLAIVTGSSRGIGAAVATNLASKGCNVVLNYTSDSSAGITDALVQELQSTHDVQCLAVQADMGSPTGPGTIVKSAKAHFAPAHGESGEHKFQIDIIINNAGAAKNHRLGAICVDTFQRLYAVNVLGPLLLVQEALPYLPTDRSGRIVNLSSVSASMGFEGQSYYGGTKAALEGMTRVWARELAERATVNAINPGPVLTDMWAGTTDEFRRKARGLVEVTPLARVREELDTLEAKDMAAQIGGRAAYPEEIAGIVGMLVSAESGWCTGSVVCANGGLKFSV